MLTPTVYLPSPRARQLLATQRSTTVRATYGRAAIWLLVAAILALLTSCAQGYQHPNVWLPADVPTHVDARDTLKVHMRSGDVYLLRQWATADSGRTLKAWGTRYDAFRVASPFDSTSIPIDSVALFETNSRQLAASLGMQGMAGMITAGVVVSAICLMDPKGCFGSCPTFYVEGDTSRVHAEGFSSSVSRVLEARDVDALDVTPSGRELAIRMRNEAMETHSIRRVNLLAVPRPANGRVFALGDSTFVPATGITPPSRCDAPDGDCRAAFSVRDGRERISLADSTDLAARETIELRFDGRFQRPGLVITARNSLVSTFLFYQTLAYFGRHAATALATMERGTRAQAESQFGMAQLLGGVEVQVRDSSGAWLTVGAYQEHGPIASDTKVIPLPPMTGEIVDVRLRAARGNWRIDWIALAELGEPLPATRIAARVERAGRADAAATRSLANPSDHLVAMPGDEYRLLFDLPEGNLELFLESEGFYYEWMRKEWMAEENPMLAALMVNDPAAGLRMLAKPYKQREAAMEQLFWSSRFNARSANAQNR